MINQTLKSLMYLIISVLGIYFLWGALPKIINLVDDTNTEMFLITIYWIGLLCILAVPQYFTWMTEDEVSLIAPIKSIFFFMGSILFVAVMSIASDKINAAITLSETATMIWAIIYWMVAVLIMYVPQIFAYEPLKEMLG